MAAKLSVTLPPPFPSRNSRFPSAPLCLRRSSARRSSAGDEPEPRTPPLLKLAVGGATELLRLFSKNRKERNLSIGGVPPARSVDDVLRILRSDFDRAYFLTGNFTSDVYAEDCLFEDPTIKFRGKARYSENLNLLAAFLELPYLELEKIEKAQKYEMNHVKATWKLRTYLNFPWKPLISIEGTTTYDLDKDFKIVRHAESWNISALEAVGQIFKAVSSLGGSTGRQILFDLYTSIDFADSLFAQYNEVLGKGSSKTVYRAFDEYEGIEVAWNQVKLSHFLQSPDDLERLYCEIHLLKTLNHQNIIKFFTSWVDISKGNVNFVTEMFTSGTLRQFRQKHKRVNIRAVKHWCSQILSGLLYLHSHDPPIIHRDLKCDNIFINGNQGEVKIGDLGLAAVLRKSHVVHCVGTPEFMAPEVYEEEYNELVDIYSFGMCLLEMVTFEYPYSECTHPAQIYKKVISGTKPEALYRVKDPEVREFIEKCLVPASHRLSARELLNDPFLQSDSSLNGNDAQMGSIVKQPCLNYLQSDCSLFNYESENAWDYELSDDVETFGIDLFNGQEDDELFVNVDITIKGRRKDDGSIFLRLRVADKEGKVRNIYFPFDVEADTALSVSMEMVAELGITEHDVTRIAEMIDGQVSSLVPGWKPGPGIERTSELSCCTSLCRNEYHSFRTSSCINPQSVHCSHLECAAMHGRFEEITYKVEDSENFANAHSLSSCSQTSLRSCSENLNESTLEAMF
ncbi:hypothetical protein J5N97_001559 [Dioscorea zingiberensis]|uniref:non-specific serine/threonine protein kinase n=1 Tax=Dioscorea zingiberensis TaxID=325984 RepID=A0A9D5BTZ1_9LILI|nr:hypothetical protein J5N97_001559 [Dioscorea zingiberensis]